ncbi:pentapeptide repeat-containing protein [Paenibacillus tundrae]|uniref:pentapeptide repeat-containing protein n=1 Tax=Paenibacillus tundrae TaxID=528187 RepID=UPI0030CE36C4
MEIEKNIIAKLESHQIWLESAGEDGKKLILDEINLEFIDLSKFSLKEARLIGCSFDSVNFEVGNFILTWVCSSTFRNAWLKDANFYKANVSYADFSNSNLKNARFTDCESEETVFFGADLSNAELNICYFSSVDFRDSVLDNANIEDSFFEDVLVNGASFRNVKGIEKANIISINIGSPEHPLTLEKEQAKRWIFENCM